MGKFIDLTGKKFGKLTIIRRDYPNKKRGQPKWLCKCDCGNEKIIIGYSLRGGVTKSCGCLTKESASKKNRLESGLSNMRRKINGYKIRAKKRGIEYNLTEEQFKEITQKDCFYCKASPNNIAKQFQYNGIYIYNGLDRIDNTKGYTLENVIPCCKMCNIAKSNHTLQEFKDWVEKAYIGLFKKREVMR